MSLTLVNNNYVGELISQLATLLTIGASDFDHFHFMQTSGSKVRFPYLSVNTKIQSFTSICDVTPQGDVSRTVVDIELVRFIVSQELCKDVDFASDYSSASGDYEGQEPLAEQIAVWAAEEVDNFSLGLQGLRWSGDTTLAGTELLSEHDGVVKLIKAMGAYNATTNPTGYVKTTTVAIDATNAIEQIGAVADAIKSSAVMKHKGFKILISSTVRGFLKTQLRNKATTIGLNALPTVGVANENGQITDGSFFGAPVYVVDGLDYQDSAAVPVIDNSNIVMAGVFTDGNAGVLKCGVGRVKEEETLTIKEIADGDKIRWRSIARQNVSIPPNVSQMAMNG